MKDIIMYGADWCKDCVKAKEILLEKNINYIYLDITDTEKGQEYSEKVMEMNAGKRIIPTFIIDGESYANPRISDLHNILDELIAIDNSGKTLCSNGNELSDGDTVLLTRDLDVKGSPLNLKQGSAIDNIKLTGDPAYIDCKIGKSKIAIKTEFVKKKG